MPAGLLERLGGRVTFVVGKGGVGKTTLAGSLALALADRGDATHLLSTDPAHSLGDLFGQSVGRDPAPSRCTDRLQLEELDAAGVAQERLRRLTPGLRDLIDRGTYLDLEDADSLLDASLPGLDEVGAALRIAELTAPRLVVDTAPTGHMLRLLETPAVVRSWLDVFEAMAVKADTVASALLGQDVRMTVESELRDLEDEVLSFDAIARSADFVVVSRPGAVVAAETRRLVDTLRSRGYRVSATAAIEGAGGDGPAVDIVLPKRPGITGCDELRAWWRTGTAAVEPGAAGAPEPSASAPGPAGPRPRLPFDGPLDRDLLVFAGKGGVGKTTCAAAVAVRLAAEGSVVLFGADPAGSLADVVGDEPVAGLELRELDGEAELERLRSLYEEEVEATFEAVGLDRAASLDRAVIESLWRLAPPGLDELMAVSRLAEEVEGGTRIVVDAAPTGHFLRLVAMPAIAVDWLRRTMRILVKYGAMGELDAPVGHLLRFAKRFRALRERFADPAQTGVVVVTLDEPMVRAETDRLIDRLHDLELPLAGLLVNRTSGTVARRDMARRDDVPLWRAPEVPEPRGARRLAEFTRTWDRVT